MRTRLLRTDLSGVLVVALAIGCWEVAVRLKLLHYNYLPPPSAVVTGFRDLLGSGALAVDVGHTLGVTLLASALAMVLGVLLGLAVGLVPGVNLFASSSLDFLRTIPTVALIPVALLIWGPQLSTEVIVATYAATWPILVNTASGIKSIHTRLDDVAKTFQLSRFERLQKIIIPATIPSILVGGRLAVVSALIVTILAEMFLNPQGVGWGLMKSQQALRPELLWAYAVSAGILGYAINAALVAAVHGLMPGNAAGRTSAQ